MSNKSACTDGNQPKLNWILECGTPCTVLFGTCFVILCISTICGNLFVIIVVCKNKKLRGKITNYFIVSLAMADFLVGLLVMPQAAIQDVTGYWYFGHYCLFWTSFDVMMSTASILNLLMISIERYIAVTKPFHYHEIMTPKAAYIMISVVWVVSACLSFIPVLNEWFSEGLNEPSAWNTSIDPVEPSCRPSFSPEYAVVSSCISFYIPTAIMIIVYSRVFTIARRHSRQIAEILAVQNNNFGRNRSDRKAIKTMALVMGVFVGCWLPFFCVNSIYTQNVHNQLFLCQPGFLDVFSFLTWLGWLNSTCNVFIYSLNPSFSKAYKKCLRCRSVQQDTTDIFTVNTNSSYI